MIILSVSDLTLGFGDRTVLSGVSFSVNEGDRVGVIGVNGIGKTTLLRAISGALDPESGSVFYARGKSLGYLAQNTAELGLTGQDTLLEHMIAAFPELTEAEERISLLEGELAAAHEIGRAHV